MVLVTVLAFTTFQGQAVATYFTKGEDSVGVTADGSTRDKPRQGAGGSSDTSGPGSGKSRPQPTYLSKADYDKQLAAWKTASAAAIAANRAEQTQWASCLEGRLEVRCAPLATWTAVPTRPNIAVAGDAAPAAPTVPPEVLAYQAVAELKLAAPRPVIGPPPEINRWKTAVVGYPLWLSTTGDPTPPAVSDTVYDVSVSLRARLQRVVFDMGDGHKVSCTDTSHGWDRSVEPNARSPWCGYTYAEPPRHSKTYRVTAYAVWSVQWQINAQTGTLPFYQQTTTDLPVAELQVLVR